jgi:GDSL-like Lipase/Acylhydrolase family
VVVYAPRQITNSPDALGYGALAAVVDLTTGKVRQVGAGVSIAYFDPGCGTGQNAVLTQGGTGAAPLPDLRDTRLMTLNAVTGKISATAVVPGQVTSAVPLGTGIAGVRGRDVVSISARGGVRVLTPVRGQAYELAPDASDGLGFLVAAGRRVQVRRWAGGRTVLMGSASQSQVGLSQVGGRVFVTGEHVRAASRLPTAWRALRVTAGSSVSSTGILAVDLASTGQYARGKSVFAVAPDQTQPVQITAQVAATSKVAAFTVPAAGPQIPGTALPSALPRFLGAGSSPALARPAPHAAIRSDVSPPPSNVSAATTTYDPDRSCSVPRNDPGILTYQPSAAQVEWAVDEAVQGRLSASQPANLDGSGLPAYSPQGLFPAPGLDGGGSVPAQVLLGILAQESNEDQASSHAIIGQNGNFEPSYNWYGTAGVTGIGTTVDWNAADCGYGIAQVTSGMCLSGAASCTSPLSYEDQLAVAVDYEANIAAGLQILEQKWNQLYSLGIKANGGNPEYIENWWFALWAYNSGIEPDSANGNTTGCSPGPACTDSTGNWGLGWVDNPANPMYPPGRPMFLAQGPSGSSYTYDWDEAHPAGWSYEEKVIGFGAYGLVAYNYVQATWAQAFALTSYPPEAGGTGPSVPQPSDSAFCSTASGTDDNCNPASAGTSAACSLANDHCWWHWPITWTTTCSTYCGTQTLTYAAGAANPGDPGVPSGYAPDCSSSPLPASAVIVGDAASSAPAPLGCGASWSTNGGTMTWNFASSGSPATYPSKVDFHQIGGGYGGHFWVTHTIPSSQVAPMAPISATPDTPYADLAITGTWTPPSSVNGWTRIMVEIPNEGAWDPQANYQISTGSGAAQHRIVNQAYQSDTWVSLGIFNLSAGASVSLSNVTYSGLGYDIAWDAMAFVPAGAPASDYVALGDSYSSGQGLQPFDPNSDYNYDGMINGCHRSGSYGSGQAYSQLVTLPGQSAPIAAQAASSSGGTQYSFLACAGDYSTEMAQQAYDTSVSGGTVAQSPIANTVWNQFQLGFLELPMVSQGWLGPQTTLVTLTAGGNDARFASIVGACLLSNPFDDCTSSNFVMKDNEDGVDDPEPLYEYEPTVIAAMQPHLQALYSAIAQAAPNAEIIVLGYPRLFPGDTNATDCNVGAAGITIPVIQSDVTSWMNQMGDLMNSTIEAAVAAEADAGYNVHFINPSSGFTGHEVCSSSPWINGTIAYSQSGSDGGSQEIPGAGSFHPKAAGQQEYATLIDECLAHTIEC